MNIACAAAVTPGSDAAASRRRSWNATTCAASPCGMGGIDARMVITPSGSNPGAVDVRLRNVRSRSIPPNSSTIDIETCAATKTFVIRRCPLVRPLRASPRRSAPSCVSRRRRVRGKPGEKRRAERAGGGNGQDATVERHVGREWKRVGVARDEPQGERLRERDADRAGDGEEREAFRPQLSGQASAAMRRRRRGCRTPGCARAPGRGAGWRCSRTRRPAASRPTARAAPSSA